ncbi:MAG: D-hydroxyproline dehydrogenase subunit beta [Solirubrobacteraceae bacterium]|nr:D-hydroxyproline dehydrogenase subunit beta [Solirubrobacteraceae bacterium]
MLLLDRLGVSQGTTGRGEGNVLRGDAPGGRAVWLELAARFPDAVKLREKGSLTLFEGDGAHALAAELEDDAVVVDDPQTVEPALAPGLPPAVFVPTDMQVDAQAATIAMAAEVPFRVAHVTQALPDRVLAGGEWIEADAVVLATGVDAVELDVRPRKGQLVALGPAPGLVTRKLIDAAYPAAIASIIEEALTGEVWVGSSRQDTWTVEGVDDAITAAMLERARGWVPALAGLPVTRAWFGYRPYRPGGPFVGRLDSGVWAITGHEGRGVGLGPLHGRQLAQALNAS